MVHPVLSISGMIALLLFYSLALIVIRANPKSWKNRAFFLYLLFKGIAVLATFMIPLAKSYQQAELYFRIFSISVFFFSGYLLLFALSFYFKRRTSSKLFLLLTAVAIVFSVVWYFNEDYTIYRTDYGWFYNYTWFGYSYIVGYYAIIEGVAIILVWRFMKRIVHSELRHCMMMVAVSFTFHYFIGAGINIGSRFLLNTSEYDLLWTAADIILFGIALKYFLKMTKKMTRK